MADRPDLAALVGRQAMRDGWVRAWPGRKSGVPSGACPAADGAADAGWTARLAGRWIAAAGPPRLPGDCAQQPVAGGHDPSLQGLFLAPHLGARTSEQDWGVP